MLEVFDHYRNLLPLSDVKGGAIVPEKLQGLSRTLKLNLKAWASGETFMDTFASKRTLYNHRHNLLKHGWDIRQEYNGDKEVIKVLAAP